jgi:hypothetical protein
LRIVGIIFVFLGIILCITIIGAGIGVILIFLGLIMIAFGGRRKTVINNVIQVTNTSGPQTVSSEAAVSRKGIFSGKSIAATAAPAMARLNSGTTSAPEFEVEYVDTDFTDARSELNQVSKRILSLAKQDGCEISARPDRITVSRDDYHEDLRSNSEIQTFGTTYGYL